MKNVRENLARGVTPGVCVAVRCLSSVILVLSLLLAVPFSMKAVAASEPDPRSFSRGDRAVEGDGSHHLGFQPSPVGDYKKAGALSGGSGLALATSVDLSSQIPPVGNQGGQGSCVAWAVSYYYKSWSEKREHGSWNLSNSQYQFSPSFIYNQINGGEDQGSSFPDAFDVLQMKGAVDMAEMPYDAGNCTRQPTRAQLEAAKPYRIPAGASYLWIRGEMGPFASPNNIGSAKAWLNDGKMLVTGMPVYSDFPDFGGNSVKAYYDYNGSAGYAGGHGVAICGYNDNINPGGRDADHRGGFKMVNSWGSGWNGSSKGYVWLSYDFVKRYVWEAWTMEDLPGDGPSISSLGSGSGNPGSSIRVNGNNFGALRKNARVTFNGTAATRATFTNGRVTATVPDTATSGPVVVHDWEGTASNGVEFAVEGEPVPPPSHDSHSYYFAEGCTREGFEEWLSLENPGSSTLEVSATYMFAGDRGPFTRTYSLNPSSRSSVNVNEEVGPGQDVSVKLSAEGQFYAERPMYFSYKQGQAGYSWTGGHCATGIAAPAGDWYFAEGTTRSGFEEWICMQNPNSEEVVATVHYTMAGGGAARKEYRLPPRSRVSAFVNDDVGPEQDVSVRVHCDSGIIAERPMYFDYRGKWDGGHVVMGADSPETRWYFAEGSTRAGFEEWLAVQNVNDTDTRITVQFLKSDGTRQEESYTVGADSRWTLDVNQAVGAGVDSAIIIDSDLPVVAERPMYFSYTGGGPGRSWTGGHDVLGSPDIKTSWFFAEGCTYDWADQYICVANPGSEDARVVIDFILESGSPVEHTLNIEPYGRATVKVADITGRGHDVSTRITSNRPVVAERPMYFSYNGWTGGHNVVGF